MDKEKLESIKDALSALCALFLKYGYKQYRMSKFEEYDLYAKNKDFLVSENVITFTDTDGKLLALKPDVTLSIIKNGKDGDGLQKVFYNEHVYRVSKGTRSFKEFMQVGLECLGGVDDYSVCEVILLAAKSLQTVCEDFVLDISHLGIVKGVMDAFNISEAGKKKILSYLGEKNAHGVLSVCQEENLDGEKTEILKQLVTVYGKPEKVLPVISAWNVDENTKAAIGQLEKTVIALNALGFSDKISVDFSVVNDMNYYNGLVFKGFISGIPTGILSGGQYDKLMEKMGRRDRAIGFAVYLDELERLFPDKADYDVDVAVEYGNLSDISVINQTVKKITDGGESALALPTVPDRLKYKRLISLKGDK
ncbi:MAG: ATP phosphoribosyltransferase regulatory subunit [Clostridia bacterium]|nr:ATP phosphoribosyltransferase regulatory subunit [Clostridia bacterium]